MKDIIRDMEAAAASGAEAHRLSAEAEAERMRSDALSGVAGCCFMASRAISSAVQLGMPEARAIMMANSLLYLGREYARATGMGGDEFEGHWRRYMVSRPWLKKGDT